MTAETDARLIVGLRGEIARLTAALADAREKAIHECIKIVAVHEGHIKTKDCVACILDQLTSLTHPTTEPAKAEKERD